MRNRIILGTVVALAALALATEAQAQFRIGGGGWRGRGYVGVSTPYFAFQYGRGYAGPYYYGGGPYYGYGYSPGYAYYPVYAYYPSYGRYYAYPYTTGYAYAAPAYPYAVAPVVNQASYSSDGSSPITLRVSVPDPNARLWIQNVPMSLAGSERSFTSPPMIPGRTYTYTIRASWMENGREVSQEKTLQVQAGQETMVRFENSANLFPRPG